MLIEHRFASFKRTHFTAQSVPVLSVHDSYIIDYTRVAELREIMAEASKEVIGEPLPTTANGIGLDSFAGEPYDRLLDFIRWSQSPRCEGYLARLAAHEGRLGV